MICLKPHWFGVHFFHESHLLIVLIFIYTCFIPLIGITLLKFIGFINTFEMREKQERIAPLLICMIFYLWLWVNLKNNNAAPKALIAFILTAIIALSLSFVINNWIKISLHAVSISAFLCLWLRIRISHSQDGVYFFRFAETQLSNFHIHHIIIISFILLGWVGTARLILHAHQQDEIYIGYLVGAISTIIAFSYIF